MKILLTSTDVRALDSAVRQIMSVAADAGANCVALPLPTKNDFLPNGELVSSLSRRLMGIQYPGDRLVAEFGKMILPSAVNILITF